MRPQVEVQSSGGTGAPSLQKFAHSRGPVRKASAHRYERRKVREYLRQAPYGLDPDADALWH